MRNWKKLVSLCLCLIMALSCCAALAENTGGVATPSDQCAHTNTATRVDEERKYSGTDMDIMHHYTVVSYYDVTYCTDCKTVTSKVQSGQDKWINPEEHTFENDVCVKCGIKYCAHANIDPNPTGMWVDDEAVVIEPYDELYHTLSGEYGCDVWCLDCGGVVNSYIEDRVEKREHQIDASNPSVCSVCGYEITCKHPNTEVVYDEDSWTGSIETPWNSPPTITPVDEKQHRVEGYRWWDVKCQDCKLTLDYGNDEEPTSELYPHTFVDGVCEKCKCDCTHINTATRVDEEIQDYFTSSMDGYHHCKPVFLYEVTYCTDCNEDIDKVKQDDFKVAEEEEHVFDGGNVCVKCGDPYCEHTNASWGEDWGNVTSCERLDKTYHVTSGTKLHTLYCPDCHYILDEREEACTDVKEKHSLDSNGVCSSCGYTTTCTHENKQEINESWCGKNDGTGEPEITVENETQHRITGYRTWDVYCPDCDLMIDFGHDDAPTSRLYPHTFVDGVCEKCKCDCTHINTATRVDEEIQDYFTSSMDGYHHYKPVFLYDVTYCTDCNAEISRERRNNFKAAEEEEHVFDGGDVCVKCGDPYCEHTNARWTYEWNEGMTVDSRDKTYHVCSGTAWGECWCPDCDYIIDENDSIPRTGVKEKHVMHDWDPNVCYVCGYEITCKHPNVKNVYGENDWVGNAQNPNVPPTITFVDEKHHRVEGYRYWSVECLDCELTLDYGNDEEPTSELYPHSFVDNVCEKCGYVLEIKLTELTLPSDIGLISGETLNVTVNYKPTDIELPEMTWSSSAPEVASVSDGVVTAHSGGTATITVACANLSDSMVITVYADPMHTVMAASLSAIEDEAFMNASLERVTLPSGCESIGSLAFAGNAKLVRVHIPASVTSIAGDAFDGCAKLTISGEEGSYAQTFAEQHGIPFKAQ